MEDFVTVTMSADESDALRAAAAAAKVTVEQYVLAAALEKLRADEQAETERHATLERHHQIVSAFLKAMSMSGKDVGDHARMNKAAKQAARQGRNPDELAAVVAWLRQIDGRWRSGKYIPLIEIVGQWAAWRNVHAPMQPTIAAAPDGTPTPAGTAAAELFGEIEW